MNEFRRLKPGDFAYIRVKLGQKVQDTFGEWSVEPINKFGAPTFPGVYLYVREPEIVTLEEARKAVNG